MARGHHLRRGGAKNSAAILEESVDLLHSYPAPPTLINGVYNFVGSEMSFQVHSEKPPIAHHEMPMPNSQQISQQIIMMSMSHMEIAGSGSEALIQQAHIIIAGNKTKTSNTCCFILTILFGGFILVPLLFMCCMWWKKKVYPMYQLTVDAYQHLAKFIAKTPNLNYLNLVVVDNAFNSQKAKILYEAIRQSHITGLTFLNRALHCNGEFNEADEFRSNMAPIKSLNISSTII